MVHGTTACCVARFCPLLHCSLPLELLVHMIDHPSYKTAVRRPDFIINALRLSRDGWLELGKPTGAAMMQRMWEYSDNKRKCASGRCAAAVFAGHGPQLICVPTLPVAVRAVDKQGRRGQTGGRPGPKDQKAGQGVRRVWKQQARKQRLWLDKERVLHNADSLMARVAALPKKTLCFEESPYRRLAPHARRA